MNLFNIDSPLYKYMTLVFDIMLVGILWLVTSIPVVTIGASTAAAFYVMLRRVSDRERTVTKDFFAAFKTNFKYATGIWLIILVFTLLNLVNFLYVGYPGALGVAMYAFHILFAVELLFISIHVYPLLSRFDVGFLEMVRSALLMAHKHLLTTLTHVALIAALAALFYMLPVFFLIVAFGPYCWLSSLMLSRMYKKYRPELDDDKNEAEED